MNPVRPGYRRLRRLEKGVWLYLCLRCNREIRSTGTGAHSAMHDRLDALHPGQSVDAR